MQALELLLNRRSQPRLQDPAPSGEALENIIQAALCAPDHKCLAPWKFIICSGEGRIKLGHVFEQAALKKGSELATIERAPQLPLRAPMVIVAICKYTEDEKVPRVEQIASTACAVHAMQMASIAQGFQGIWRTGWYAQDEHVKQALSCDTDDEILGFLYLGTTPLKAGSRKTRDSSKFVEYWQ